MTSRSIYQSAMNAEEAKQRLRSRMILLENRLDYISRSKEPSRWLQTKAELDTVIRRLRKLQGLPDEIRGTE